MALSQYAREAEARGADSGEIFWGLVERLRARRARQEDVGRPVRLTRETTLIARGHALCFARGEQGVLLETLPDNRNRVLVDTFCLDLADDEFEFLEG